MAATLFERVCGRHARRVVAAPFAAKNKRRPYRWCDENSELYKIWEPSAFV